MYLLDTNVVSETRKTRTARIDANVEAWWSRAKLSLFFISVITLFEIEEGVLRIARRDATQGEVLRTWLDDLVLPAFAGRLLPVTPAIARACAALQVPDKRQLTDALIAATARGHDLKVVSRNVAHFEGAGVEVINPWVRAP